MFLRLLLEKLWKSLPSNKPTAGEIQVNVLKTGENCFFDCINEAIRIYKFPDSLKLSDITPVYKTLDPSDYRSVSVLPLLSKVFEKIIYEYWENFLSNLLCDFQKAHST